MINDDVIPEESAHSALNPDALEDVLNFLIEWQPFRHPQGGDYEVMHDFDDVVIRSLDSEWMILCGFEMDKKRLHAWADAESTETDLRKRSVLGRQCEALAERLEHIVSALMLRFPEHMKEQAIHDQMFCLMNNIAGLRYLNADHEDSLASQLLTVLKNDCWPIGWAGEWPAGKPIVYCPVQS